MWSPASLAHASLSRRSMQIPAMPSSWTPALCLGGYTRTPYPSPSRAGGGCSHLAILSPQVRGCCCCCYCPGSHALREQVS